MPDLRSALLRPLAAALATACLAFAAGAAGVGQLPPAAPSYDFDKDIKPILESTCVRCHGEKRQKSDFRLDTRAGLLQGGEENEKVFIPGHSATSPLIRLVSGLVKDLQMPPKKEGPPLTAKQIGLLRAWIDAGAKYPGGVTLVNTNASADSAESAEADKIAQAVLDRGKDHWAFKTPARPTLPRVSDASWAKTPIDAFVLARLEKEGLDAGARGRQGHAAAPRLARPDRPAADAARSSTPSWPTPRRTPTTKQVERLLASPHYGERWARHWLDAARYADCDGFEKDKPRYVWVYRDWVIDALNRDLPYDQFVVEQLAGDLLPNADAGPDRRHRLPAQLDGQRGGRRRSRAVPHGGDVRPHGRHRQGRARPDHPVRPVPQPQVRSDHAGGLLPAVRLPEQRPRSAASRSTRPPSR